MSAEVFEIIELENGDLALRKQNQKEGTFLVRIEFSDSFKSLLSDNTYDIAQVMLKAGMEKFYQDLADDFYEVRSTKKDITLLH